MKSFFSRPTVVASVLITAIIITLTCCTSVDDRLGSNFVPTGQRGEVGIAVLGMNPAEAIKSYVTFTDTIRSGNQGITLVGNQGSTTFGTTNAATTIQFMPASPRVDTTDAGFGHDFEVDSVFLVTQLRHMGGGDKNVIQTFNIYEYVISEPEDSIRTDTAHYINYDWESRVVLDKPLFTFDHSGADISKVDNIKLTVTDEGEAFVYKLMSDTTWYVTTDITTSEEVLNARNRFRKEFHGLVLAPAENSPEGVIYWSYLAYDYLMVYFHNYKEPNNPIDEKIKDTTILTFYFDDSSDYSPRNQSIISVNHKEYANTIFDGVPSSDEPVNLDNGYAYVQGFGGISTVLEFSEGLFEAIDVLKGEDDDIYFNRAMLYLHLDNPNDELEVLNAAHAKLGSYLNFNSLTPIPDYLYAAEASSVTLPYGGVLNRNKEKQRYELDITGYLHRAYKYRNGGWADDGEAYSNRFTLAPVAYPYTPNQALIWGETKLVMADAEPDPKISKQPKIELTYTKIKKHIK